jgi:hypothetical protein
MGFSWVVTARRLGRPAQRAAEGWDGVRCAFLTIKLRLDLDLASA